MMLFTASQSSIAGDYADNQQVVGLSDTGYGFE